ncbi:hypothetical protein AVEN_70363-1 [Araneus ventricosus]|uniref:Uncharacterized protein n=1 Tax=Araneus ventricosus TaxID=182803 RepID=A0A4Y2ISS3_ARAVE|nr:hypothetical protein AVEN_70363-1 [Araneus ventricosus]
MFNCDPTSDKGIHRWYQRFESAICLCKGDSSGRPKVPEEDVGRVRESFLHSLKKSEDFFGGDLYRNECYASRLLAGIRNLKMRTESDVA